MFTFKLFRCCLDHRKKIKTILLTTNVKRIRNESPGLKINLYLKDHILSDQC